MLSGRNEFSDTFLARFHQVGQILTLSAEMIYYNRLAYWSGESSLPMPVREFETILTEKTKLRSVYNENKI